MAIRSEISDKECRQSIERKSTGPKACSYKEIRGLPVTVVQDNWKREKKMPILEMQKGTPLHMQWY